MESKLCLTIKELAEFLKTLPEDAEISVNDEEVWYSGRGVVARYNKDLNVVFLDPQNLRYSHPDNWNPEKDAEELARTI